jgi:hypothetical protein
MADPIVLSAALIEEGVRKDVKDKTLEEQVQIVMRAAHDDSYIWMLGTDDQQFKAGVGALLIITKDNPKDHARVKHELETLNAFARMLAAHRFDFDEIEALSSADKPEPLRLTEAFRAAKRP